MRTAICSFEKSSFRPANVIKLYTEVLGVPSNKSHCKLRDLAASRARYGGKLRQQTEIGGTQLCYFRTSSSLAGIPILGQLWDPSGGRSFRADLGLFSGREEVIVDRAQQFSYAYKEPCVCAFPPVGKTCADVNLEPQRTRVSPHLVVERALRWRSKCVRQVIPERFGGC